MKRTTKNNKLNVVGEKNITNEIERNVEKPEWIIIGRKKVWKRRCNHCGNIVLHKSINSFYISRKHNKKCEKCRQPIGFNNSFYGKKHTNKIRKLYSRQRSGKNNPMYGKFGENHPKYGISKGGVKHHSLKSRLKISLNNKGKLLGNKNPTKRPEVRRKIRESILEKIKSLGYCGYNPKACEYIDNLNKEKGWNLQHALNGGEVDFIGYRVDGYDNKRNIVVEYDEPKHYNVYGKLKEKDIYRQKEIINYLKCKFYRYNVNKKKFYRVYD